MAQLLVPTPYATISDALLAAIAGDTIVLAAGYGPETVTISLNSITLTGPASVQDVTVFIAPNVSNFALLGEASVNLFDMGGSETITGNAGDNRITLTGGVDHVDGGGGTDRLVVDYSASQGVVTASTSGIDGDLGTVQIAAGTIEAFTLFTGAGADNLTFTTAHGSNEIDAGEGANTIVVGDGDNTVKTGAGIDTITFGNGNNTVDAGAGTIGANTISGGSGNNIIRGGNGVETITLGGGDNQIYAGDGANTLTVGPTGSGNNVIIAGAGIDTIAVGDGNNFVDAGAGTIGANTITVGPTGAGNNIVLGSEGIDTIAIGNGNNYIAAGGGANTVTAGSGNNLITAGEAVDTITAMGGNNVIEAGDGGANTVTTGAGNDVTQTGSAADTVDTGAGNDILKDSGGAGTLTAGAGHDRLIMDYAGTAASVSNTANTVSGTYSGVINATNFSGVEEFHITGGSGADSLTSGIGADVLIGGGGADTLRAGGGSDVIYGGIGDVISGGEDASGADFDLLVLAGFGDHQISYATDAVTGLTDSQSGRVDHLDASGNVDGSVSFTGIESIVFALNTVFTLEDTPLEGDLFDASNLAVSQSLTSFTVGTTTYAAGETAARTEGNLTLGADGHYSFVPAPNYNGPAPVTTYRFTTASTTPAAGETPTTATAALIIEVQPVAEPVPNYATTGTPTITAGAATATLHEAGGADNTTLGTNAATITMSVAQAEPATAFDQAYLANTGWSTLDSGASYTKFGSFGTARFTVSTGAVAYALDDSLSTTQSLSSGDQVSETFTIQITSAGVISTADAVFTILGQNDTPSLSHLQTAIVLTENAVNAGYVPLIANPDTAQNAFAVLDAEGNFDGGTLTVSGFLNEDLVRVFDQGAGVDLIDVVGSSFISTAR
jgi:VCBS repeat-containing protein